MAGELAPNVVIGDAPTDSTYVWENNELIRQRRGWADETVARRDAEGNVSMDAAPSDELFRWLQGNNVTTYMLGNQNFSTTFGNAPMAINEAGAPTTAAAISATAAERVGILGSMREGFREAMGTLRGAGQQEAADIRETSLRTAARGQQELVTRGFAGTTILPTVRRGAERQKTAALGRLGERLRREKLGLMTGLRSEMFRFRERGVLTPGQTMQWGAAAGAAGIA